MRSSSGRKKGDGTSACGFKRRLRSDDVTKIAAVILAGNARDAERDARAALSRGADLAELRLDHLDRLDSGVIRSLSAAVGPMAIATLRSPNQGGLRSPAGGRGDPIPETPRPALAHVAIERRADRA